MNLAKSLLIAILLLLYCGCAFGQAAGNESAQNEPAQNESERQEAAIVELGGAASWNVKGGSSFGPDAAIEFTPIEHWLEIEAGVTPLFTPHSTEWDVDLLLKKPWTLSDKVEFMAGVGPEWIHTTDRGITTNSPAIEIAADFMFWPGGKHQYGWFLEPAYEYNFGPGHEQSVGITFGLLIAIPR